MTGREPSGTEDDDAVEPARIRYNPSAKKAETEVTEAAADTGTAERIRYNPTIGDDR